MGKPLVVFVHGSPGSWDAFIGFMDDADLLARARLVSVDRPGFGRSGRHRPEPSLIHQAGMLEPILEADTSGRPAILIGHSMGGPIIARAAMDFPERVGGLIMVAPSIDPELEKIRWFQYPADWAVFSWFVPPSLVTSNREVMPLKGELEDMLPLWREITRPVTVIQGEKDRLVPAGNADFAVAQLVNAPVESVRLPNMNHFVPWTHPDLIKKAILRHLDETVAAQE
jgi:pimeloyl-ACP methyl ester carboxylesterase